MSVTRLKTHSKFAIIGLCAVVGLAACGDDNKSTDTAGTASGGDSDYPASPTVAETTETTDTVEVMLDSVDVMLAESSLGQIMVDGDGNTLYLFTSDTPGTVTCAGDCAAKWPGVPADDALSVGEGLDDSLFSTVTGANGEPQLEFNGHPLYYFAGDTAPGDTNGQGVKDVWFVVGADGNAIAG